MTIDELQCVRAVADNKTFLDAADELNRSQSSLSKAIRRLEDELGVAVFSRTTRSVSLTSAGVEMLPHIRMLLDEYESICRTARAQKQEEGQTLRIGSIYFGLNNILVPLVAKYMNAHPTTEISISESTTTPLLKLLGQRNLDAVFVSSMYRQNGVHANFSEDPRYMTFTFSIDPYYVIVGREHHLAGRKSLTYKDLDGEKLITTDKTMDVYHTAINEAFTAYGAKMHIATRCTNVRSVLHMVSQHVGIAILSRLVVEQSDRYLMIPLEDPLIRETQLVILKSGVIPPHVKSFFKFVVQEKESNAPDPGLI